MPPSFLLTAFLLISHLAAQSHAAETFMRTIPNSDLRLNCALTLGGYEYDLCPLVRQTVLVEEIKVDDGNEDENREEGPSSGRRFFEVNLGGLAIGVRESMISGVSAISNNSNKVFMFFKRLLIAMKILGYALQVSLLFLNSGTLGALRWQMCFRYCGFRC
jgi:hypothetical protein